MTQFAYVNFCISYCKVPESPPAGGLCVGAGCQLSTSAALGSPVLLIAEGRGSHVPRGLGCGQGQPPAHGEALSCRSPGTSPMAPSILDPRKPLATAVVWQLSAVSFPINHSLSGVLKKSVPVKHHCTASTYVNIHFARWLWTMKCPSEG